MELVLIPLMLVGAYFLLIRPQQKRAKETEAMAASLVPGSRVMTTSGVYATVKHLGEKQLILEISPGVEMTVVKAAVLKLVNPEDDEFEYTDAEAEEGEPVEQALPGEILPGEALPGETLPGETLPEAKLSAPADQQTASAAPDAPQK
jgi:preprotein translocase subunit YajC